MSTALAIEPVRRPAPALPTRPMPPAEAPTVGAARRPASPPVTRAHVAGAVAVAAGVACVITAQLLLSIGTAESAYRLAALREESTALARQQQVRAEELRAFAAPARLAAAAAEFGMVPDDAPAYLDAGTGRVLGSKSPTRGSAAPPGDIVD